MGKLLQDVKYSLRTFARNPSFTAVAVLTLALGIGANTAIFSVINGVLLRPLPFRDPGRLVALWETEVSPGNFPLTGQDYLDWQAQNHTLEATSLMDWSRGYNMSGAGAPEAAVVSSAQANLFSVLGVQPLLGRAFETGEDSEGKNHVAILQYGFWKRQFGGQADAIGRTIELNGEAYTVVGVMPEWFAYPDVADLWVPMDMSANKLTKRGTHNYRAIGRMKPGITPEQAQADLAVIAERLEKQHPDSNNRVTAVVVPLKEQLVGETRTPLLLLLGAVGLVLLVACANVANLLLARATGRSREFAVRSALGAGAGRILRQLLTESVMLSLAGAALGFIGAQWLVSLLRAAKDLPLPAAIPIPLDTRVLIFTAAVSAFVGILFGLAPALHLSGSNLGEELKAGSSAVVSATRGKRNLRDVLVAAEIAISLALLLGAGLLLRTFRNLREVEIGVNPEGVLMARIALPKNAYPTLPARQQFYDRLIERLDRTPGVQAAAISNLIPLQGGTNGTIEIRGDMDPAMSKQLVEFSYISPDFFRVYQIPLLAGRGFTAEDMDRTAEVNLKIDALQESGAKHIPPELSLVAIVSRKMAQGFWPNKDVIGKVFQWSGINVKIIGVAGDVREWGLREAAVPQMYLPVTLQLDASGSYMLSVKSRTSPASLAGTIRSELREQDSRLALFYVRTMDDVIAIAMQDTSFLTVLLGIFAALAVVLAAVGIYGVMSYTITQRTHEIGIRMAMGAEPADVLRMVLRQGARLALAGTGIGLAAALLLTRLIAGLLYGVSPRDPVTFAGAAFLLMAVALLACYLPARRAMRVDPIVALRYE